MAKCIPAFFQTPYGSRWQVSVIDRGKVNISSSQPEFLIPLIGGGKSVGWMNRREVDRAKTLNTVRCVEGYIARLNLIPNRPKGNQYTCCMKYQERFTSRDLGLKLIQIGIQSVVISWNGTRTLKKCSFDMR